MVAVFTNRDSTVEVCSTATFLNVSLVGKFASWCWPMPGVHQVTALFTALSRGSFMLLTAVPQPLHQFFGAYSFGSIAKVTFPIW